MRANHFFFRSLRDKIGKKLKNIKSDIYIYMFINIYVYLKVFIWCLSQALELAKISARLSASLLFLLFLASLHLQIKTNVLFKWLIRWGWWSRRTAGYGSIWGSLLAMAKWAAYKEMMRPREHKWLPNRENCIWNATKAKVVAMRSGSLDGDQGTWLGILIFWLQSNSGNKLAKTGGRGEGQRQQRRWQPRERRGSVH